VAVHAAWSPGPAVVRTAGPMRPEVVYPGGSRDEGSDDVGGVTVERLWSGRSAWSCRDRHGTRLLGPLAAAPRRRGRR
jgi:hypothetical protein